ncbi:MAG: hypothetical protein IE922_01580 [Sphingomonadales bacterium]|nr:hypothetical protein [Sphingomonadales bacterium]
MTHEPVRWTRGRNTQDGAQVWLGAVAGRRFAITVHKIGGVKIWNADDEGRLGELVSVDLRDIEAAKAACVRRMGRRSQ